MVQGRISFSRGPRAGSFNPGQPSNFRSFERIDTSTAHASRLNESAANLASRDADDWIYQSIGRKHARLIQITVQERQRIEEFVDMLFEEESDRCQDMLQDVLEESGDPQKVVEILMEPAARLIGDNWCADECDFLKVTIAVLRMQRLFRRMASDYPPAAQPDLSRWALLCPAPGEQHTFGLSVVEDAFRRAGWEVDCCGCDEEADMLRLVALNHYQVVGVSVSVERRLPELKAISRTLRAQSRNQSIVLIAGGSMVMQNPQGAIDAGFDLLAVDAVSAVSLADTAVASLNAEVHHQVAAE